MKHEVVVPVGVEPLREAVADTVAVARAVPGFQQDAGEPPGTGRLKVRAGGTSITYRGTFRVTPDPDGFRLDAEGTEVRGTGTVRVTVTARLVPDGTGTSVRYDATAEGDGRAGELAAEAVEAAVTRLLTRFTEALAGTSGHDTPHDDGDDLGDGGQDGPDHADDLAGTGQDAPPDGDARPVPDGDDPTDGDVSDDGRPGDPGPEFAGVDDSAAGIDDPDALDDEDGIDPAEAEAADVAESLRTAETGEAAAQEHEDGHEDGEEDHAGPGVPDGQDTDAGQDAPDGSGAPDGPDTDTRPEEPDGRVEDIDAAHDLAGVADDVVEEVARREAPGPPAEAAHARRTMIGRSAEEVDHAPPRGRYAPVAVPEATGQAATLRWAAPAAALVVATAIVVGRALRRRQ
ncbi:SRPBCC family protein [Streptomyces uncialis]|uniref:SRPBCC family protein n=1 Tax=Streptomyces uncialis TaxID=1048205 RepID=UPI00382424B0